MVEITTPLVKIGMPPASDLMPELERVLYSGQIGEGPAVYEFERSFAEKFDLPLALAMSSGTAALHASLTLAGVSSGDEVISTAMTAEPTNVVIAQMGAKPVWADVDPTSGNLEPASVAERISSRTRAILVVHYAGLPVRLNEILDIGRRAGIPVIEDCAHALGARYAGRGVGVLSDFAIFSLQAIKHMTTVDGGVLSFRDLSLEDRAKRFRWFGLQRGVARTETNIAEVGYKYNMNNVTACLGKAQLRVVDDRLAIHKYNGAYFDRELARIPGLAPATYDDQAEPSYWLYTLLSDDWADVQKKLAEIGVESSKLHRRNDAHAIFAPSRTALPGLDTFYDRMIHLPCGWWVDPETRERMVDALAKG